MVVLELSYVTEPVFVYNGQWLAFGYLTVWTLSQASEPIIFQRNLILIITRSVLTPSCLPLIFSFSLTPVILRSPHVDRLPPCSHLPIMPLL